MPQLVIYLLWGLWSASWLLAALWSNPTAKRAPWKENLIQRLIVLLGIILLFGVSRPRLLGLSPLWSLPDSVGWLMAVLVLAGFAFCWWARVHLGLYWSSVVGRKEEHRVIDTGPYAVVRHPIYSGLIVAAFATAIAMDTLTALAGAVIITIGWFVKARMEEKFLREELGPAYDDYAARVAMLVPFLKI